MKYLMIFIYWNVIGVLVGLASPIKLGGMLAGVIALPLTFMFWRIAPNSWFFIKDKNGHVRGAKVVANEKLLKLASVEVSAVDAIRIGNIPIPTELENRHFLFAGATGSGKSQSFYQIAEQARTRKNGAVIADVNGEFVSRFYQEGDVLLSPFDSRSPAWSPLSEMGGVWDADRIAKSIIPDSEGTGAEWNHYAQVILAAVLTRIWQNNGNNGDLTHYLMFSDNIELAELCDGSEASRMFADGNDRMLSSILSIVASYAKPLTHLPKSAGLNAFSISKFIKENSENNMGKWLFFPVRDDMFKMLSPLIAAQIDIAISALLSASDNESRRVWFFLDEFASWGKIEGIEPLLTKSRKKGGAAVLGLQSVSQVREKYGQEKSKTLLSNCGNWLTLRAGDGDTAEWLSKNIGDEDIMRIVNSNSDSGTSTSEQYSKQRVVLPSELQTLPDLKGILNVAGPLPSGWVQIPISKVKPTVNAFELIATQTKVTATQEPESFEIEDFIP